MMCAFLHAEVRHECHLQEPVDVRVGVDRFADGVDQLDDPLGHEVAGSGLTAEDEGALRNRQPGILLEPVVQRDDVQHVEMLALVLVDALDLDVEHPVRVQLDARRRADVLGQARLVAALDVAPLRAEGGVLDERLQPAQARQVGQPAVTDGAVQQLRSPGLASARKRRGVTPLVLLLNRSGHSS